MVTENGVKESQWNRLRYVNKRLSSIFLLSFVSIISTWNATLISNEDSKKTFWSKKEKNIKGDNMNERRVGSRSTTNKVSNDEIVGTSTINVSETPIVVSKMNSFTATAMEIFNDCSNGLEDVRILRKSDILARNQSPLQSFHEWSIYLHFIIYNEGPVPMEKEASNFCLANGTRFAYHGYPYVPPTPISVGNEDVSQYLDRKGRFPSIRERVKFYMGRWYDATPNRELLFGKGFKMKMNAMEDISQNSKLRGVFLLPHVDPLALSPQAMFNFSFNSYNGHKNRRKKRLAGNYVRDIIDLAILRYRRTSSSSPPPPVLIKMGDGSPQISPPNFNLSHPVFAKARDIIAEGNESHERFPAHPDCKQCGGMHDTIIWPLNRGRHFKAAAKVPRRDIPWEEKANKLIWRGGAFSGEMESLRTLLPIEISSWKQRKALVTLGFNSTLIDAKFIHEDNTNNTNATPTANGDEAFTLPEYYYGDYLRMDDMLQYKYLIAIEGNDVSSGLKWMLFSNSVVFLPPVTYASWAMEPLLQPFVHYVPVHANMSNVEEMVQWAEDHPAEARSIAIRSTLFVYDLLFHPDAYRDEELILAGIVDRYNELFRNDTN